MRGNFFYKRLGEKLLKGRHKKNISQEQLSLLADVDRTYIARIEEGKANPTVKVLNKLGKTLGLKLENLLEGV